MSWQGSWIGKPALWWLEDHWAHVHKKHSLHTVPVPHCIFPQHHLAIFLPSCHWKDCLLELSCLQSFLNSFLTLLNLDGAWLLICPLSQMCHCAFLFCLFLISSDSWPFLPLLFFLLICFHPLWIHLLSGWCCHQILACSFSVHLSLVFFSNPGNHYMEFLVEITLIRVE